MKVETFRCRCQSLSWTLWHWCRNVGTPRHQPDGAERSEVRSVCKVCTPPEPATDHL